MFVSLLAINKPRITGPIDACCFIVKWTENKLQGKQIELTIRTGTRINFTTITTAHSDRSREQTYVSHSTNLPRKFTSSRDWIWLCVHRVQTDEYQSMFGIWCWTDSLYQLQVRVRYFPAGIDSLLLSLITSRSVPLDERVEQTILNSLSNESVSDRPLEDAYTRSNSWVNSRW